MVQVLDVSSPAWRVTASELDDPTRREVLLRAFNEDDFVEAGNGRGP